MRRVALALLLLAAPALAGGPGTAAGTFLRVPVGGRAVGMGGAHTAVAVDAYAPFYNPGGLGFATANEFVVQQNRSILDMSQQYVALVLPFAGGWVGASWDRFDFGDFDGTWITSGTTFASTGEFGASSSAFSLAYGYALRPTLSIGVQGKLVNEDIASFNATAAALDLGLHYRPGERFSVGFTVANLGSDLKLLTRGEPLPRLARLGFAYRSPGRRLLAALDLEKAVDAGLVVRAGGEYWVTPAFAARLGFDSTSEAGDNFTVGLGFRHRNLSIDYAFTNEETLETTHRLSLGYRWNETAEGTREAAARRPAPPAPAAARTAAPRTSVAPAAPRPTLRPLPASETATGPVILLLDLRGDGAEGTRTAGLAAALVRRGFRVRRSADDVPRAGEGPTPDVIVSGTVARTGFSSLLVEDVATHRFQHVIVYGERVADASGFGEAAAAEVAARIAS